MCFFFNLLCLLALYENHNFGSFTLANIFLPKTEVLHQELKALVKDRSTCRTIQI